MGSKDKEVSGQGSKEYCNGRNRGEKEVRVELRGRGKGLRGGNVED